MLVSEDWRRMEYSHYLLKQNDLDETVVMEAIRRARRRFFLRTKYFARHAGDMLRLAISRPRLAFDAGLRAEAGKVRPVRPRGSAKMRQERAGEG